MLRVSKPSIERLIIPDDTGRLDRIRIPAETRQRARFASDHARQTWPGQILVGLERMAGRTVLEQPLPALRLTLCDCRAERQRNSYRDNPRMVRSSVRAGLGLRCSSKEHIFDERGHSQHDYQ